MYRTRPVRFPVRTPSRHPSTPKQFKQISNTSKKITSSNLRTWREGNPWSNPTGLITRTLSYPFQWFQWKQFCTTSSTNNNNNGEDLTGLIEEKTEATASVLNNNIATDYIDNKDETDGWTLTAASSSSSTAPTTVQMDIRTLQQVFQQMMTMNRQSPQRETQPSPSILPNISKTLIQTQKKCVVNIEQNVTHGLNSEKVGVFSGTGFIVDAKEGIIATNYHIIGSGPQQVKITFENGESTEANVLYYDCWHDFAFYKINPKSISFELQEAQLGSSFELEEQAEVFLIGNNDDREYSVKIGTVSNLAINSGKRHSYCLQTSFDRTGGSSGSPVFDNRGRVVAIHTSGTNTTSFELRIEYIKDALAQILAHRTPDNRVIPSKIKRGDIGVELDLIRITDAVLHFNFPQEIANELKVVRPMDMKYIAHIHKMIPLATAGNLLRPGDMIWKVDGQIVGSNLFLFDKLVDSRVGHSVEVTVIRNGEMITQSIPVTDVEKQKVKKFAMFAGGVFHDTSLLIREKFEVSSPGVFLSHVTKGSCLSGLGSESKEHPMAYATVIEEISGFPTPNLDAFIHAIQQLLAQDKRHINVISRNLRNYRTCLKPKPVVLDLKFSPLRVFEFSEDSLNWVEVKP